MFSLGRVLSILLPRKVIFLFPLLFLFAVTQSYALEVTLGWDANTEPDLAGYKVYYKTGSSGPPYNGTGADQGSSPVTVPIGDLADRDNPEYTLSGLSDSEVSFLVVTAYDTEGLESDYSNEVPPAPISSGGGGEGGDGGGCFIAIAAFGLRWSSMCRSFLSSGTEQVH
jgi:hypothetical protein